MLNPWGERYLHHSPSVNHALFGRLKNQLSGADPFVVARMDTPVDSNVSDLGNGVVSSSLRLLKKEPFMGCNDS